ncbi:MAG TPA: GtrA family protein [Candidatus Saccharimonadales bacterium]
MRERTKLILRIREGEEASYKQVVNYLIGGGLYFITSYAAFYAFYHFAHWTLLPATVLSNIIGWITNYFINRYWVFKHPSLKKKALKISVKYTVLTLVNFLLSYLILRGLKSIGISPYIGQFISAICFFTPWNYYWYKLWVFKTASSKVKSNIII